MKALITGASSGIGREIAIVLSELGYEIYAVARRGDLLEKLNNEIDTIVHSLVYDLSSTDECFKLYNKIKDVDFDIVINNAGIGVCGAFEDTDINREISMINTNITALHILTKLFYIKFKEQNKGRILNVASTAGYMMGPFLSSYYASKSYVLRFSQAINRELKESGSDVCVSVLCPGPAKTEFDKNADVKNSLKGLDTRYVAKIAINGLLKGRGVIIPGFSAKVLVFLSAFIPDSLLSKITYIIQKKKL